MLIIYNNVSYTRICTFHFIKLATAQCLKNVKRVKSNLTCLEYLLRNEENAQNNHHINYFNDLWKIGTSCT